MVSRRSKPGSLIYKRHCDQISPLFCHLAYCVLPPRVQCGNTEGYIVTDGPVPQALCLLLRSLFWSFFLLAKSHQHPVLDDVTQMSPPPLLYSTNTYYFILISLHIPFTFLGARKVGSYISRFLYLRVHDIYFEVHQCISSDPKNSIRAQGKAVYRGSRC